MTRLRQLSLAVLALAVALGHGASAQAAESITLTPPADAIAGTPFTLTVSATSDSASSTELRVFVRPDDGHPCEASAAAVRSALPRAVEVYDARRPTTPVAVAVPAQPVGGLRVCAFVELVAAPQTTFSAQELAMAVRAPLGTVRLLLQTVSPVYGQTFSIRTQGSTEAASGNLVTRAQRGPCTPPDVAESDDSVLLAAGPYDEGSEVTIDPDARVQPDRVCAWLYAEGGMVLATAEQPISLGYDGALAVTLKRFIKVRIRHRHGVFLAFEIKGHTTSGKVAFMRARIVRGGSCVAVMSKHKGANFDYQCLLRRPPRRPFVVAVTYTTGMLIERSAGRVTIAVPKQRRR